MEETLRQLFGAHADVTGHLKDALAQKLRRVGRVACMGPNQCQLAFKVGCVLDPLGECTGHRCDTSNQPDRAETAEGVAKGGPGAMRLALDALELRVDTVDVARRERGFE